MTTHIDMDSDAGSWGPMETLRDPRSRARPEDKDSNWILGIIRCDNPDMPLFPYSPNQTADLDDTASARLSMVQLTTTAIAGVLRSLMSNQCAYPSLSAIIDNKTVRFSSVQEKVDALEESWRKYNAGRSITDYNHFSHYQIIGLGSFAIPFLLEKVRGGSSHWFVALKAISGVSAELPETRGNPKAARDAWLEWGKTHESDSSLRHSRGASSNLDATTQHASKYELE
jgi:hypothetical protein